MILLRLCSLSLQLCAALRKHFTSFLIRRPANVTQRCKIASSWAWRVCNGILATLFKQFSVVSRKQAILPVTVLDATQKL